MNSYTSKNGIQVFVHPTGSHPHRFDILGEAISLINIPDDRGYYKETVDLGHIIGFDHLVELNDDAMVYEMHRPIFNEDGTIKEYRKGTSPMVLNQLPNETSRVTVVMCVDRDPDELQGKWCIITLFEGEEGEPEPWNDRVKNDPAQLAKSIDFFATHGFVPTEREWPVIAREMFSKLGNN